MKKRGGEGKYDFLPVAPGCPEDQDVLSFYHQRFSLVLFESGSFHLLPSLPQGCRGFDFVVSFRNHYFCACCHPKQECDCRPGVSGSPCFTMDGGSRLLRFHFPRDLSFSQGNPLCFEGMGKVSLLHSSFGKPSCLPKICLGSFFQLVSFPMAWAWSGLRVRASSGASLLKVPARKPAGPSRLSPDCFG